MKLPRPDSPVVGNVLLAKDSRGDEKWLTARLVNGTQDVLRPLIKARVSRVSDHGLVIEGTEVIARTGSSKSNTQTFVQVWWVFVITEQGINRYDGHDPLEAIADARAFGASSAASQGPAP
ncbi:hypothetical protein [Hydrogenophaga sp.]|uniref:hypothetical protein n=1 Tax=Hydrogenophaga sp. TaxID=1904254 RepID=UPI003D0C70DF